MIFTTQSITSGSVQEVTGNIFSIPKYESYNTLNHFVETYQNFRECSLEKLERVNCGNLGKIKTSSSFLLKKESKLFGKYAQ